MNKEKQTQPALKDLPATALPPVLEGPAATKAATHLRAGDLCPICRVEYLDYNGLLNLACPRCGYALSGCFT